MASGGRALSGSGDDPQAVAVLDAGIDLGTEKGRAQLAEVLLDDREQLPDQRRRGLHALEAVGPRSPEPHGVEGRLHHIRGPQVPPVLPREGIVAYQPLVGAGEALPLEDPDDRGRPVARSRAAGLRGGWGGAGADPDGQWPRALWPA